MGRNDSLIILLVGGGAVAAWYFLYYKKKKTNLTSPFFNGGKMFGGIIKSQDGNYEYTPTDPFSVRKAQMARAYPAHRLPKVKKARSI